MSQVDRAHFLSTLIWIILSFLLWYFLIFSFIYPSYYRTLRGRAEYEIFLYKLILKNEFLVRLFKLNDIAFFVKKIKLLKIFNIVSFFKSFSINYGALIDNYNEKKNFFSIEENLDDMGFVFKVSDDIAYARGLLKAQMTEMVTFNLEDGKVLLGIVNYLDNEGVAGITVLGDASVITAQTVVVRSYVQPRISAGYGVLGRVVSPIGEPLDGQGNIESEITVNIEKNAPSIIARKPVREPLETGVKFIDSMIPIGCGQRELIIGDKKTGKTAIAIDTIINQRGNDIVCVYIAIGQKKSSIARVAKILREKGCMEYTVIVASGASDS